MWILNTKFNFFKFSTTYFKYLINLLLVYFFSFSVFGHTKAECNDEENF